MGRTATERAGGERGGIDCAHAPREAALGPAAVAVRGEKQREHGVALGVVPAPPAEQIEPHEGFECAQEMRAPLMRELEVLEGRLRADRLEEEARGEGDRAEENDEMAVGRIGDSEKVRGTGGCENSEAVGALAVPAPEDEANRRTRN